MIFNKPGEAFVYEGRTIRVGDWFTASGLSDYAGLTGTVYEIRNGKDMGTENDTPDLYCKFLEPDDPEQIRKLEEHFSVQYGEKKTLNEIAFDCVILSPDEMGAVLQKPPCYQAETDNPYPLCIGNLSEQCDKCACYRNLDFNLYE